MAETKNREGQVLMDELKGLFPEISFLLDLSKLHLDEPAEDVEIVLDQNKTLGNGNLLSPNRNRASLLSAVMKEEEAADSNKNGKRLKTLLVRDTVDRKLVVSGGVVEDASTGVRRKLSAEELALPTRSSSHLIVNQANYSLLQHAQDTVSGFLNPDFYRRLNDTGYKPTWRSLLRHAVNSAESVIATDLPSVVHAEPSQGILNRSAVVRPASNIAAASIAESPNVDLGHSASELRRKLGLDDSLTPLEKSTVVGLLSVGVALSLLKGRSGLSSSKGVVNHIPSGNMVQALKKVNIPKRSL